MALFNKKLSLGALFTRKAVESESAQFGRDARTDWQVVGVSFLVLLVAAVAVSMFVYGRIHKGEIFLVGKKESMLPKSFDRFELENTVSFFERKKERFDLLKQKEFSTKDPFIPALQPRK